jgi:hypothetical protein
MNNNNTIIDLIEKDRQDCRAEERAQTIRELQKILTFLSYEPPLTISKLREYILAEFVQANTNNDPQLMRITEFYRNIFVA